MKPSLSIALTLLLLAGGATARGQQTNSASAADQDPFLALERNNIFDESRVPHDYRSSNINRPRVETITLCGIGVYDRGRDAIFQGSDKWFKAGETIKGLKIVRITLDSVTLADTSSDPQADSGGNTATNSGGSATTNSGGNTLTNSGSSAATNSGSNTLTNFGSNALVAHSASNIFVLDVDARPTLRREGDGPWRLSAYIAPEPAPAANTAVTATAVRVSGAGDNDIIAKLRKKREQEEK
jgi:hypothetical protein